MEWFSFIFLKRVKSVFSSFERERFPRRVQILCTVTFTNEQNALCVWDYFVRESGMMDCCLFIRLVYPLVVVGLHKKGYLKQRVDKNVPAGVVSEFEDPSDL